MSHTPKRRNEIKHDPLAVAEARIAEAREQHAVELDLSGLSLIELPESLGQLTQIQTLHLDSNQLATLPKLLCQLMLLQNLYLRNNRMTAVPDWLGELTQLQRLALNFNQLTALPESFLRLIKLRKLHLNDNQLTMLPESLGQLEQLQQLYLSANQLRKLPDSLGQLRQLTYLSLHSNQLTTLPKSLGKLRNLTELYFFNNQLTALPEPLGQLRQLQALSLYNNRITVLPDSLGQLGNLTKLDLSNNQLAALPESLEQLKSLKELYLHGNDGLTLPAEVLGPTWKEVSFEKAQPAKPSDILAYYFRLQREKRPLNEAKLILVGRGAVGKTSLVNRLVHNRFDKSEKKTEGIQITQWPLRLKRKEEVRLNIWDFGGQEIMHATHQFFLTQRSLYLLVLNGREGGEDADAEYWLKLIESFGAGSPVLIVLNKSKGHPFDLNRRALQQKYPNIRGFIATDCKDRTGLKELRKAIAHETDQLEHLRDAFPASWFSLKDKLAGMKKNYLSFEEYRKVCGKHGLKNSAEQESLAFVLHCLGIALNYKDDPRLQDTHVLNPH